jgi:hypothetical protein
MSQERKDRHTRWTVALEQLPETQGHVPGLEQQPTPHIHEPHTQRQQELKMRLISLRCTIHYKCPK